MLVDSHCHLDFNDFEEDFEDMLARARENGVTAMLNAGNNIDELDKQLEISEKYPFIYTAVGVHPHNAAEYPDIRAEDFIAKAAHKKVVAIGECGLDYYYDYSPKDVQVKVFVEQIKAARETGLPLIIHTRDADDDTIAILDEEYKKGAFSGEIHCFSSSKKLADFALSIGFYISASGIITFNKSGELRDIFAEVPLDRLLVETPSYMHYLVSQKMMDELFFNYSCIYVGGQALTIGKFGKEFGSKDHPHTRMLSIHSHSDHFFYFRHKLLYD